MEEIAKKPEARAEARNPNIDLQKEKYILGALCNSYNFDNFQSRDT